MTAVADFRSAPPRRFAAALPLTPLYVAAATLLTLATTWSLARFVLAGGFTDPDDAMRLVEIRAWMAGQSWFDVGAMRLDPPAGASMHWSRLVDVPNALLIRLFDLATPRAEAWDRIVLPTILLAALYAGFARLATVLLGRGAQAPALIGLVLSGVTLVQFQPGRIGHHGPETVALVWAVAMVLGSFDAGKARQGALAGLLVALALAMSLETMPFMGALCAAMLSLWVVRGRPMVGPLRAFSAGLGLGLPPLFLATTAPATWFAPICDAVGAAHLGVVAIFAAGSFAFASAPGLLRTWPRRLAAAAALGLAAFAFMGLAYPACLHSPFSGVDPLVREIWLDHVVESQPLPAFLRDHPSVGFAIAIPLALGNLGTLWAALTLRGLAAQRFAVVAGLGVLGLALGFWQVRVLASAAPFALCGGVVAVTVLRERLARRGVRFATLFATVAILPFTATGWAIALPQGSDTGSTGPSCLAPTSLAPLASLPAGRIVAPVDAGSHLLEATPHTVFAAPYHRDNDGNRFALDVFLAKPAEAEALLAARHVAYIMTCPGLGETARLAARAPDSLAARLQAGVVPDFLQPVHLPMTPYRIYALPSSIRLPRAR